MNAIRINAPFQASSVHVPRSYEARAFISALQWMRSVMTTIGSAMAGHADSADEKRRLRTLKHYHRNQALLPSNIFRPDRSRDDVFSRRD